MEIPQSEQVITQQEEDDEEMEEQNDFVEEVVKEVKISHRETPVNLELPVDMEILCMLQ